MSTPLCIGWETIRRLRDEGQVLFDDGRGLVAASDLFRQPLADPQALVAAKAEGFQNGVASAAFPAAEAVVMHIQQQVDESYQQGKVEGAREALMEAARDIPEELFHGAADWLRARAKAVP